MLRSVTIDNKMLTWLAEQINKKIENGDEVTRSMLSNLIWKYEKEGN